MNTATATEEAAYEVILRNDPFELRDYEPQIVAEVTVTSHFEDAGNRAFNTLFRYISGHNQSQNRIAMTSPVGQEPASEKIAMTAPVGQVAEGDRWVVSFMMPATYTMDLLPVPNDPAVRLREIPARRMAAVRYSGRWSERNFQEHKVALSAWIESQSWEIAGEPVWARYNAPFTPWFLRRNEILIPVAAVADGGVYGD